MNQLSSSSSAISSIFQSPQSYQEDFLDAVRENKEERLKTLLTDSPMIQPKIIKTFLSAMIASRKEQDQQRPLVGTFLVKHLDEIAPALGQAFAIAICNFEVCRTQYTYYQYQLSPEDKQSLDRELRNASGTLGMLLRHQDRIYNKTLESAESVSWLAATLKKVLRIYQDKRSPLVEQFYLVENELLHTRLITCPYRSPYIFSSPEREPLDLKRATEELCQAFKTSNQSELSDKEINLDCICDEAQRIITKKRQVALPEQQPKYSIELQYKIALEEAIWGNDVSAVKELLTNSDSESVPNQYHIGQAFINAINLSLKVTGEFLKEPVSKKIVRVLGEALGNAIKKFKESPSPRTARMVELLLSPGILPLYLKQTSDFDTQTTVGSLVFELKHAVKFDKPIRRQF